MRVLDQLDRIGSPARVEKCVRLLCSDVRKRRRIIALPCRGLGDAHNVRREFRKVVKSAELNPKEWTPRELRHSFVSLMSDAGVPLEDIARLVGHSGSRVTELVYRHQIRPVLVDDRGTMDRLFSEQRGER